MPLPDDELGLVIRTTFGDDAAWETVQGEVTAGISEAFEDGEPWPLLLFVDDPTYSGLTVEQAGELIVADNTIEHATVFLVDRTTLTTPEHLLLAVTGPSPIEDDRVSFRLRARSVARLHLMLSTKMDFSDYLDDVDEDGLYAY